MAEQIEKITCEDAKSMSELKSILRQVSHMYSSDPGVEYVLKVLRDYGFDANIDSINGWYQNRNIPGEYMKDYTLSVDADGKTHHILVKLYADEGVWRVKEINAYMRDSIHDANIAGTNYPFEVWLSYPNGRKFLAGAFQTHTDARQNSLKLQKDFTTKEDGTPNIEIKAFDAAIADDLIQSASKEALQKNIKTEIESGKDPKQAAAIAYSVQRKNDSNIIIERFEDYKNRIDKEISSSMIYTIMRELEKNIAETQANLRYREDELSKLKNQYKGATEKQDYIRTREDELKDVKKQFEEYKKALSYAKEQRMKRFHDSVSYGKFTDKPVEAKIQKTPNGYTVVSTDPKDDKDCQTEEQCKEHLLAKGYKILDRKTYHVKYNDKQYLVKAVDAKSAAIKVRNMHA